MVSVKQTLPIFNNFELLQKSHGLIHNTQKQPKNSNKSSNRSFITLLPKENHHVEFLIVFLDFLQF